MRARHLTPRHQPAEPAEAAAPARLEASGRPRARRLTATAALTAAALTALLAAPFPANAATPRTTGLRGPVVTHPVQQPFDYPAGEVCPFPSHADFPVSDLTTRTWTDSAGNPVVALETGPLIMKVTNLDTGKSVVRDISGNGVITYPDYPSADTYVLSGNDWSAGFHTADRPMHNQWIVASTYMSVKITTVNGKITRQLLALHGPYEDICKTLA